MQVKLLQQAFQRYQQFLGTPQAEQNLYIWESQQIFQDNWDLEASRLPEMYDHSLQNSQTRRLWKRETYEPKRLMLLFWEMAPDFVRNMFQDLFNEEKAIDGRVSRFVFYCDQLLEEYRDKKPHSIENNHYHDDGYQMISLYLAFRYPDIYTLYRLPLFQRFLEKMGVHNIPQTNDFERFVKVSRTVYKLMEKEESLLAAHQKRLEAAKYYSGKSLLVVFDFMDFVAADF